MEDYDDEPDPAEELEREEWVAEVKAARAATERQLGGAPSAAAPEVFPPPPGAAPPEHLWIPTPRPWPWPRPSKYSNFESI